MSTDETRNTVATLRQAATAAPIAMIALALLGIGLTGEARAQCKTGSVEVTAIGEAEYEELAILAGGAACVTPSASGLTLCQITPPSSRSPSDEWIIVAQASEGGSDAQSAVELSVLNGTTCLFTASAPSESTDSRWILAETSYQVDTPASTQIDFVALVQIGPNVQTTATSCPFGDGHDGSTCHQCSGAAC